MLIEEELKKVKPFYLLGKSRKVIKAVIYYLETPNVTQWDAARKFGVTEQTVGARSREIRKILNIQQKRKFDKCSFCGDKIILRTREHHYYNIIDTPIPNIVGRLCERCFRKWAKHS